MALFHPLLRDAILSSRILTPPFRLADLSFGSEEAEGDELLEKSYVRRPSLNAIVDQQRSIVIGDRGSGKSAIFRKLAMGGLDPEAVKLCPVADSHELLRRIVAQDATFDVEGLRAAWLVIIASVAASAVPASAPKPLRRAASRLRVAFGFEVQKEGAVRRALRTVARPFAGTTLKFAVGPVNLEAQLPKGSPTSRIGRVDVEAFFKDADDYFRAESLRVVVMFDRIDEAFKYDRAKQETLVQALLQAEARVSLLGGIRLLVFLRTDLFELYDIQEKTKLVSRSINLKWSEEDWIQLLVNRVFANQPVHRLAQVVRARDGPIEPRTALEAIFPAHIEDQPVDRWLIDSLRNGNGDVSPRLAVLLLLIARDLSLRSETTVSTLPLFSFEAVRDAMTRLSELSYSEVVNDFKVASTFVANCRAGKLASFGLADVQPLFDENEGKISDQVRLLERLGFLERVVLKDETGTKASFSIPKLYTRCWAS